MISVILYGRNDNHGYNLHRRVALSLNCIAEVLDDPEDEIVFVDWNSPGRLPTLIEDISDTLTDKCKSLLKIIKVSEQTHNKYAPKDLKRPTIEPYARNVGIRASNANNKWLLSTNTDMIFSLPNGKMSTLLENLQSGYYMAFRYEIPEFLWSTEPRNRPTEFISKFNQWSEQSTLKRQILLERADHALPDAPGDFQLAPRETWLRINGFPESMLYGWHVDSAVNKLLIQELGFPKILDDDQIITAHCNHLRNLTHFHEPASKQNNFDENTEIPKSQANWGLSEEKLIPILLTENKNMIDGWVQDIAANRHLNRITSRDLIQNLKYPVDLAELFLMDVLVGLEKNSKVLYFGINIDFADKLKVSCEHFGLNFDAKLLRFDSEVFTWNSSEIRESALIILDLGLSDLRFEGSNTENQKIAIGRMIGELSVLANLIREFHSGCLVAAVGPLVWSARILFTSEFASPLFNNYGLVLTGPVREKSLLKNTSALSLWMLRSSVSGEYGIPGSPLKGIIGKISRKIPKSIKLILRPLIYWLLRSTGALR
jgi:hypothetical protein